MVGVVIGVVGAIVLMKVLRRRFGFGRRFAYAAYGGYGGGPGHWHDAGCPGPGGHGGPGHAYRERWIDEDDSPWEGRRWGRRGGFAMNAVFDRIHATPAQEKVIRAAFDELRTKARAVKDDARGMRGDLATALRGESLDAETLGTVASRASGAVDGLRDAAIGAVLKVHEVLDEKQRAIVADALESGFGPFSGWRRGRG
jgi:uncharacterized membrane protein